MLRILVALILILSIYPVELILASDDLPSARRVRSIEVLNASDLIPNGLAYMPETDSFFIARSRITSSHEPTHPRRGASPGRVDSSDLGGIAQLSSLTSDAALELSRGLHTNSIIFSTDSDDAINLVFDEEGDQFLFINVQGFNTKLEAIPLARRGKVNEAFSFDVSRFGLRKPKGMTIDASSGDVFVLDGAGPRIVQVRRKEGRAFGDVQLIELDLSYLRSGELRGIAFDPTSGRLQVLDPDRKQLHEISIEGRLEMTRDLSELDLGTPEGMVFAPSGDQTDDPTEMSLYIADSGRNRDGSTRITELSFILSDTPELTTTYAELVNIFSNEPASVANAIDTFDFDPPSPDPSGIGYLGQSGTLLISDGEVNEIPSLFTGDNLFEISLDGSLLATTTTVRSAPAGFSNEPNGLSSINPLNNHIFFTDDGDREVSEVDPGPDGAYGTADDTVTEFSTRDFSPASNDPEGIAFAADLGELFVADGVNDEVYRINPGANGIFDGPPAGGGDDVVTHFDTQSSGLTDPEGIEYDPSDGTVLVIGRPKNRLFQFSVSGTLLTTVDISAATEAGLDAPAGLAIAPSSQDPTKMSIYIADRAVDNGADPNENDGRVYEVTGDQQTQVNQAPLVDAGPQQTVALPGIVNLDGSMVDDGLPNPPAEVSTTWSLVSGPGTVTFADQNAVDTTASFSTVGVYILRLVANDSELVSFDEVMATILPEGSSTTTVEIAVAASTDDVEQTSSGTMQLSSTDLDIGRKFIGLRFESAGIPQQAVIIDAYVQFRADETNTSDMSLTINGQAHDNAPTFASNSGDVSSRSLTNSSVVWTVPSWTSAGQAGSAQRTPDLSTIIQELVNRPGWTVGSSIAIIIDDGNGARAADSFDKSPSGAPLLFVEHILGSGGNMPPSVSAGADQSIVLPASVSLDGTVDDDGMPDPPGSVTTQWALTSGPGTVTFGNVNAIDTSATFSTSGNYVLRLAADDNQLTAFDELTVSVNPARPENQAPLVDAGPDQTISLPSIVNLDGTISDDGLPNPPASVSVTWSLASGPAAVNFGNVNAIDTTASFSIDGTYVLRLTADDGQLTSFSEITVTVLPLGSGTTTVEVRITAGIDDVEETSSGSMEITSNDLDIGTSNRTVGLRFKSPGIPNQAPIVNAFIQFQADGTHSSVASFRIQAEAIDDAPTFEASNSNLTSRNRTAASVLWAPPAWTTVGEAAAAQQTSDLSAIVQELVNRPGWTTNSSLVFIIGDEGGQREAESVDGNQFAGAPMLHVEYANSAGGNQAPIVVAGPDQNISLADSASLDGTVTDDGLPNPPALVTATWNKVNGPGVVTFGDASAIDTTASFSMAGSYVLRLVADDGERTSSDELDVNVTVPGSSITIESRVAASSDDAEEHSSGSIQLTSTDLDLGAKRKSEGIRFVSLQIPPFSTIVSAYVQFEADESNSTTATFLINGEAIDNAPTFTSANDNITSRDLTAATVIWSPPAWLATGDALDAQRTPDLSAIVQEIVNRPGWALGNSIVLIINDSAGLREAVSFDRRQSGAPLLHIEYQ